MKKFVAVLVVVFVMMMGGVSFAQSGDTHAQVVYTVIVDNDSNVSLVTGISTSEIRPTVDKVIGFQVFKRGGVGGSVSLWDNTPTALITAEEAIGEVEATAYGPGSIFFVFPRYILTQVTVVQDPQTMVIVYYIRS